MRFQIHTGRTKSHIVEADSSAAALAEWMAMNFYETREQAARECFCKPDEIEAEQL